MRRLTLVTEKGLSCDGCGAELLPHGEVASCEPCDFDLCGRCIEKERAATVRSNGENRSGATAAKAAASAEAATTAEEGREQRQQTTGIAEGWMTKMRKAFLLPEGAVAAAGVEWDTGAARRDDRAAGPRICYEGKQGLRVLGGEARWLKRPMVGADGWLLGWRKICRTRLRGLSVDKEGYVVRAADGGRLTPEEARRHGLAVEALVRRGRRWATRWP